MLLVAEGLYLFKRWSELSLHFIKKGSAESVTEISIIEMTYAAPETIVAVAAFGNEAVDVRVPFQIPAKGMEDHDKAWSEVQGFILFRKHPGNDAVYGMKETVQKRTVIKEKLAEPGINGKDTMPVGDIDELKGHGGSAFHGILVATGGAEAAVTEERDGFQFSAERAAVQGTAERRIATVNHLIDIFHFRIPGADGIYNFFVMVSKNLLKDIHKTIMQEKVTKRNP